MKENNVTCNRICRYSGYCPHQAVDNSGTPTPLPTPTHIRELASEVGAPTYGNAVTQLQVLWQKGYIDQPIYTYSVSYDSQNQPTWHCECALHGWESCTASFPSKSLAKKQAAFAMLCRVLAF